MARFRNAMRHVPSSPRCKLCAAPFEGVGGAVFRHFGFGRFPGNPAICASCIKDFRKKGLTGAEIQVSLLFADVRGSTGIAEGMRPAEFRSFLDGFYRAGSEVILGHDGLVDKLVGDEIIGLFFGGITGPRHTDAAIEAAIELVSRLGRSRRVPDRTDPDRRRRPHRRGLRRNHWPAGGRRRLHRPRRRRQHDGTAGVYRRRRRDPGHGHSSRGRRVRARQARAADHRGPWPPVEPIDVVVIRP